MLLLKSNNLSSSQSAPWSVQGEFVFIISILWATLLTLIDELAQLIIGMSRKKGWLYNTYKIPSLRFNIEKNSTHHHLSWEYRKFLNVFFRNLNLNAYHLFLKV